MGDKICNIEGCGQSAVGQSKYCKVHRAESRQQFKAMITQKAVEREGRSMEFAALWHKACEAGRAAAQEKKPQMVVAVDVSGLTSSPFPICGFSWVHVSPGNCPFANWLKKKGYARAAYSGGVEVWIGDYNQSYDMKMAHADAAAAVLRDAGIKAYGGGRLD